ncbi:MAG: hypothetical protein LBU69_01615, partial [Deltaproteobacteria bacterium]|nr:hypothetical protein [Deltaproteobacteria bacterium]
MKLNLKSLSELPLTAILKRVDFVKGIEKLAKYEPGSAYVTEPGLLTPAFVDQEQIARLAVDLTERAFQEKSDPVNQLEIRSHVDLISC